VSAEAERSGRRGKHPAGSAADTGWRSFEVDGFEIRVGKGAQDNDRLTFRGSSPADFWLHAAGYAGSHVVVRNPDRLPSLPRTVVERAAELAAYHSKARDAGGKVDVHMCRVSDVGKPRGWPAGKVQLRRWESVRVYSRNPFPEEK
jgi:predicted ribosome quality control (RQC) complex YloA/Tae2 family protein